MLESKMLEIAKIVMLSKSRMKQHNARNSKMLEIAKVLEIAKCSKLKIAKCSALESTRK